MIQGAASYYLWMLTGQPYVPEMYGVVEALLPAFPF